MAKKFIKIKEIYSLNIFYKLFLIFKSLPLNTKGIIHKLAIMAEFTIDSTYSPKGDQPYAIDALVKGVRNMEKYQTLLV